VHSRNWCDPCCQIFHLRRQQGLSWNAPGDVRRHPFRRRRVRFHLGKDERARGAGDGALRDRVNDSRSEVLPPWTGGGCAGNRQGQDGKSEGWWAVRGASTGGDHLRSAVRGYAGAGAGAGASKAVQRRPERELRAVDAGCISTSAENGAGPQTPEVAAQEHGNTAMGQLRWSAEAGRQQSGRLSPAPAPRAADRR
jgi:hypothetical protein